jgi:PKD repeat protein
VAEGSHLTTFDWTFGDGTEANGVDVTHIYTQPGLYDVTLTVTDDKDRSDAEVQQIEITGEPVPPEPDQPVAVINAPPEAEVGQPVPFDGSGSQPADSIVSYTWAFGDGTTADAIRVEKTYDAPGVYNATLIVTDDQGVQSQPATHQINILPETALPTLEPEATPPPEPEPTDTPEAAEQPPTAAISVSTDGVTDLPITGPVPAEVDQTLYFIGTSSQPGSNPIVSYEWAFGDGETATGEQVTHDDTWPLRRRPDRDR